VFEKNGGEQIKHPISYSSYAVVVDNKPKAGKFRKWQFFEHLSAICLNFV